MLEIQTLKTEEPRRVGRISCVALNVRWEYWPRNKRGWREWRVERLRDQRGAAFAGRRECSWKGGKHFGENGTRWISQNCKEKRAYPVRSLDAQALVLVSHPHTNPTP